MTRREHGRTPAAFLAAGVLLGVGLGGFADGILLHQVLQWHHLLTAEGSYPANTVAGLETNTLWDGLFQVVTWAATAAGLLLLWRSTEQRRYAGASAMLMGLVLAGWGAFNLVEAIVDHQILALHHVRDDVADKLPWDLAFLALGALLVVAGTLLVMRGMARRERSETGTERELGPVARRV